MTARFDDLSTSQRYPHTVFRLSFCKQGVGMQDLVFDHWVWLGCTNSPIPSVRHTVTFQSTYSNVSVEAVTKKVHRSLSRQSEPVRRAATPSQSRKVQRLSLFLSYVTLFCERVSVKIMPVPTCIYDILHVTYGRM